MLRYNGGIDEERGIEEGFNDNVESDNESNIVSQKLSDHVALGLSSEELNMPLHSLWKWHKMASKCQTRFFSYMPMPSKIYGVEL